MIAPARGAVADAKAIERFHIEVDLSVSLRSPNLPDFYDAELLPDGTAVLVLESSTGSIWGGRSSTAVGSPSPMPLHHGGGNLRGHAARKLLACAAAIAAREPKHLAVSIGAGALAASSVKRGLDIDWDDPEQKASAVKKLRHADSSTRSVGA